jgi:hypothetical protein
VTRDFRWRLHLESPPSRVYGFIATDFGRGRFWVERSEEHDGLVQMHFADGQELIAPVLERRPPQRFAMRYFGGSELYFELRPDGRGGTDLELVQREVPAADWPVIQAAWPSVLLALKAACDFEVDLRNHDPRRTWNQGYVDN